MTISVGPAGATKPVLSPHEISKVAEIEIHTNLRVTLNVNNVQPIGYGKLLNMAFNYSCEINSLLPHFIFFPFNLSSSHIQPRN